MSQFHYIPNYQKILLTTHYLHFIIMLLYHTEFHLTFLFLICFFFIHIHIVIYTSYTTIIYIDIK